MQLTREAKMAARSEFLAAINAKVQKDNPQAALFDDSIFEIIRFIWDAFKQYVPEPWRSLIGIIVDILAEADPA